MRHHARSYPRRTFLQLGSGAALALTAGCNQAPRFLSEVFTGSASTSGIFQSPVAAEIDPVTHHLNRLSFGPGPGEYARVRKLGRTEAEAVEAYIEEQLHPERIEDRDADGRVARLETLRQPLGELFEIHGHVLLREMVHGALLRAVYSKRQLYEVMVQFWTDHFNISPSKGDCEWLKAWDDREVIRKYGLGNAGAPSKGPLPEWFHAFFSQRVAEKPGWRFPDMVRASALSPAMLWYLDGRENRKASRGARPNENYARELLELHTLGVRGGYTQKDVMEVARCLTGWTVRPRQGGFLHFQAGKVEFDASLHDDGPKEVLGHRIPAGLGKGDLERVLEIVSLHPSTAEHIATKLCRRFISDTPALSAIASVRDAFLKTKGEIRQTLRTLFATEEFRQARGLKFKRPFNFLVSALRVTDAKIRAVSKPDEDGPLYQALRRMGHAPFDYPMPDGYPEEAGPWLGTLHWRWHLALALAENRLGEATVRVAALRSRAGGDEGLMATVLGRKPSTPEVAAYHASGAGLALLLASPAFQKF